MKSMTKIEVLIYGIKEMERTKMTKRERIKNMMEYIDEFLDNFFNGFDVSDESFIIKYKDGTIAWISMDDETKFSKNISRIDYIIGRNGDDEWDSENKSWYKDFAQGNPENLESCNLWNDYVNLMLYS